MINKNIYIDAIGIYEMGGYRVLLQFIKKFSSATFLFDSRLDTTKLPKVKNIQLESTNYIYRIIFLLKLKKKLNQNNIVICISGTPPIINLGCRTFVLFQNVNLFYNYKKTNFFSWIFSIDFLRFVNLYFSLNNFETWIVLSDISKEIIIKKFGFNKRIIKLWIFNNKFHIKKKKYDFIYPASLMKHKNHKNLIKAFLSLKKKYYPSLVLTLSEKEKKKINYDSLKKKINIYNFKILNEKSFFSLFSQCKYLIYPSLNESLALPIMEAINLRVYPILPRLPYAQQFIKSELDFDPYCSKSIANTIKIALKKQFYKKYFKIKNENSFFNFDDLIKLLK